jgi:hypothetical protein
MIRRLLVSSSRGVCLSVTMSHNYLTERVTADTLLQQRRPSTLRSTGEKNGSEPSGYPLEPRLSIEM